MDKHDFSARRRAWGGAMKGLMVLCAALTCALAAFLIIYVLAKGIPNLSWQLLTTKPSYLEETIGILPDIISTVCMVLTTLVFVLPLGVCAAVYLTEYAANKRVVAVIMVSGNRPNIPSLFQSVRFLTTAVASEMAYAGQGLQRQALFSIALVLFLFIMLINAALNFFLKRSKER